MKQKNPKDLKQLDRKRKNDEKNFKSTEKYLDHVQKKIKTEDVRVNILEDPVKLFYEFIFWMGLVLIAASYFIDIFLGIIIGLILIFLSLFVYELHHQDEEEKRKKGKTLTYISLSIGVVGLLSLLYILRSTFLESIRAPLSRSWLLYTLIGLFLADIVLIVYHLIKSRSKEKIMGKTTTQKPYSTAQPGEKKGSMLYTILYFSGILLAILALFYKNWATMILGFVLAVLSMLAYRYVVKPYEQKREVEMLQGSMIEDKLHELKAAEKQSFQKIQNLQKTVVPAGTSLAGKKLIELKEAEKKARQEVRSEENILKELKKRKKQEEKLLRRKNKIKEKQEKSRLKQERLRTKKEEREREQLDKATERLKKFEKRKERLKKKENLLVNPQEAGEKNYLGEDITKLKSEVKNIGKYETDFDKLYELIEKYKVIKMAEISEIFGISKDKAEEWAQILETHNLASTHYPAIGGPVVRKLKPK